MGKPIGPREAQLRAQREQIYQQNHRKELSMTKVKGARKALEKTAKTLGARRQGKTPRKAAAAPAPKSDEPGPRKTRAEQLVDVLRTPGGVTCKHIEVQFGWLPHTTRAAISKIEGVQKVKDKARGGTVYSLPTPEAAAA